MQFRFEVSVPHLKAIVRRTGPSCHTPNCSMLRILDGEKCVEADLEKERKDGSKRFYSLTTVPFMAPGGELVGVIENIKDITERQQAVRSIKKARDKFEQRVKDRTAELLLSNEELKLQSEIASNMSEGVYLVRASDYKILYTNPGFDEMFGYDPGEMIGQDASIVNTPSDMSPQETVDHIVGILRQTGGWRGEIQNIKKDGTSFWSHASASIYEHHDYGKIMVSVHTDITERKRSEEEKEQLYIQLQQVQKMESIGTLAGGIAHDFNNMLGIIVGNTELAMDDVPEWNPARNNLNEIRTASMRARDVVKQILAFSRQSPQEMKPVRISPIIKESLKLLRSSIPTTIEIHQDTSSESDTVRADPTQINQVLINLCTNAAHAMGEKGGALEVSLKNIEIDEDSAIHYHDLPSGRYVRLKVSDTGHGIEPKILERIFDPYFTTKGVGEGSGMGLSVVHGIVKAHGGDILVDSELGKGTTFQVLFPCTASKPEPEIEITAEIPRGNESILFVDDEKAMVDAIQPMIERLGYIVTARTSSIEALGAFRANPDRFDLVITDFTMPNMTGMELAKELLKLRSDIPVILCTGYSAHINEDKAKGSGIRAFVMKPVVLGEIANTIRKVLDQEKEQQTMALILIIDDDNQFRAILREMLERAGYEVVEASDGEEGIKLYREKVTDLIITDLIMPEKEGIETIVELRRDFPDVKIIAISGGGLLDPEQYLSIAKRFGAQYTFAKPVEREELLKAVSELLKQTFVDYLQKSWSDPKDSRV